MGFIKVLSQYWAVISGLFIATMAVGAGFQKIITLEDAMIEQVQQATETRTYRAKQDERYVEITSKQSALDERTKMMLEILKSMDNKLTVGQ